MLCSWTEKRTPGAVTEWLRKLGVKVLNIAGPRESKCPGIHESALLFVRRLLLEG